MVIQIKMGKTSVKILINQGKSVRFEKQVSKIQPSVNRSGNSTAADRDTVMAYSPVA